MLARMPNVSASRRKSPRLPAFPRSCLKALPRILRRNAPGGNPPDARERGAEEHREGGDEADRWRPDRGDAQDERDRAREERREARQSARRALVTRSGTHSMDAVPALERDQEAGLGDGDADAHEVERPGPIADEFDERDGGAKAGEPEDQ